MTQFYVFTAPDGWAWAEIWEDGTARYVPTPFRSISRAVEVITERNPGCVVDELIPGSQDWREARRGMAEAS